MKLAMQYEGWLREAGAGFISACLTLPLCVGAGVLAFAPLGVDTVPEAALAGLLCAIAGGAVAALVRRSSFVVSYPTTPICVIQGSILLGLTALPGVTGSTLVLAMTLCVLLAGLWQLLFAYTGMARAMRFVPHPVMAGFVTGVAALIAWHQVPVLLGPGASGWRVGTLFPHPWATLFGGGLVAFMLVLGRTFRKVPNLLAGLLVGTAGFHVLGHLLPTTDLGGVIGSVPPHALRVLPHLEWGALPLLLHGPDLPRAILLGSLTLALVATLDTFFALRTAQFVADIPVDPRRDVLGQGVGNLVSALVGGLAISTSLSVSMANQKAGGRTRISTLGNCAVLFLAGVAFPPALALLPRVVLAAILCTLAIRLVDRWSFQVIHLAFTCLDPEKRQRALRDSAVVVAVFLATLLGQPVAGVGVGVGLSCVLFMLDMSRPRVATRRDHPLLPPVHPRPAAEERCLGGWGGTLAILELQGVLFFGNAQTLAEELRAAEGDADLVILDCRNVHTIDSSALGVLGQAANRFRAAGKGLLLCGAGASWQEAPAGFPGSGLGAAFETLEAALLCAEEQVLTASHLPQAALACPPTLPLDCRLPQVLEAG